MSVDRGRYYRLDGIGTDLWQRLESSVQIQHLTDELTRKYQGDPARIALDVLALLQAMAEEGLIETIPGS